MTLLVLFLGTQLIEFTGRSIGLPVGGSASRKRVAAAAPVPAETIEGLIQIDYEAKWSFMLEEFIPFAGESAAKIATESRATLKNATFSAEQLLAANPSDVSLARRVILLRSEYGLPPLSAVFGGRKRPVLGNPLDAYSNAAALDTDHAGLLTAERNTWQQLFTGSRLAPSSIGALIRAIDRAQNLKWYTSIAIHQAYLRSMQLRHTMAAEDQIRGEATVSVLSVLFVIGGEVALGLIGLVLWTIVVIVKVSGPFAGSRLLDRFGAIVPDRIHDVDRKLGAGDLFDCFVLLLVLWELLPWAIGLLLHAFGLHLATLSPRRQDDIVVLASAVSYVLGGLIALGWLTRLANSRAASLADEIGLTKSRLGSNILMGIAGWGMTSLYCGDSGQARNVGIPACSCAPKSGSSTTGGGSGYVLTRDTVVAC